MKVVITSRMFSQTGSRALPELRAAGHEVTVFEGPPPVSNATGPEELWPIVRDADAIIAGVESYPAELLARLPRLRLISRRGIGYDAIDLQACAARGITVMRTAGAVEGAVAEHVMACVLHFARGLTERAAAMRAGIWWAKLAPGAKTRVLGLVGFGGIGREIARRALPFGMRLIYHCRHPRPEWEAEYHAVYRPLDDLLAESDYVSLNVPLTPETRGMIGARELSLMKPETILINIARGPVVDVPALARALRDGAIAGAAVDVFEREPCVDSPLRDCPNALLTPHIASFTTENAILMSDAAVRNVLDWAAGHPDPAMIVR